MYCHCIISILIILGENLLTTSVNYPVRLSSSSFQSPLQRPKLKCLCDPNDLPVNRKHTVVNPLENKLSEDICTLIDCITNNSELPRTILKNGKRSRTLFESSRTSAPPVHSAPLRSHPQPLPDLSCPHAPQNPSRFGPSSHPVPQSFPADFPHVRSHVAPPHLLTDQPPMSRGSVEKSVIMSEINQLKHEIKSNLAVALGTILRLRTAVMST